MSESDSQLPHPLDLSAQGLSGLHRIMWNNSTARLYETAIRRHEGILASNGSLAVEPF